MLTDHGGQQLYTPITHYKEFKPFKAVPCSPEDDKDGINE